MVKKVIVFALFLCSPAFGLTTWTVVDSADDGTAGGVCPGGCVSTGPGADCTFRAAIECTNITGGDNSIVFNIPAASDPGCNPISGVCTITPTAQYFLYPPPPGSTVIVDGSTEPGASCGDLWSGTPPVWTIVIDFSSIGFSSLVLSSSNSTIKGLHFIKGILTTNPQISGPPPIYPTQDAFLCNKIESSPGPLIDLSSNAIFNTDHSYVGGLNPGDGNVIVGQTSGDYVVVVGPGTSILGNFIGVEEDGSTVGANVGTGILVTQIEVGIGIDINSGAIKGNIISGNTNGIHLRNGNAPGSSLIARIKGNYIGTDRTGLVAIPNGTGIYVERAALTVIGCASNPACKNIISGNTVYGINITDTGIQSIIEDNFVGVDFNGNPTLCNGGAPGNDIVDMGTNSIIKDNTICQMPTSTPTSTPTLTPTITPTPTLVPLPSPGCCGYTGDVACYDNILSVVFSGPAATSGNCGHTVPTFIAGFGPNNLTPLPTPFVSGYCAPPGSGDPGSVCVTAPPAPTSTPTIAPTNTPVTPVAAQELKLILNDATTNPPTQSWAQELLRRLRNYTFLQPK